MITLQDSFDDDVIDTALWSPNASAGTLLAEQGGSLVIQLGGAFPREGSLEALNAGITTLLDWSHINNTPDHADAAIQGLKDAGIRAVYAHGMPTGGE